MESLTQVAPWPTDLEDQVKHCSYRAHEGWYVRLNPDYPRDRDEYGPDPSVVIGHGATLVITTEGYDSYHPELGRTYRVRHMFIVPAATYNRDEWARWLLDRFIDVEIHEACEHFIIDGERPFAPLHGPGMNPYVIHQYATDLDKRTRPGGEVVAQ